MRIVLTRMMKSFAFVAVVLFAVSTVLAEGPAIAVVDMQRVINESTLGKNARNAIVEEAKKRQEKIAKSKAEIDGERKKLESQAGVLARDAYEGREQALTRRERELARSVADEREEMARKERTETEKIVREVRSIVDRIAKDRALDLVLEKNDRLVMFAREPLDLTAEVVRHLDTKNKG